MPITGARTCGVCVRACMRESPASIVVWPSAASADSQQRFIAGVKSSRRSSTH